MATRRKGRTPGVVLIGPSTKSGKSTRMRRWRARITDPDSGDFKWETLPSHVRNAEDRAEWALQKSDELSKRREELDRGMPRATGKSLADTVEQFFDNHPELEDKTVESLRGATNRFVAWCAVNRVRKADDLTRAKLKKFRAHVVALPKRQSAEGVKQGGKVATKERRSPVSINNDLRNVARVLRDLIDEDAFSKLQFDDVRRSLKRVKTERRLKEFLRPHEIRELLEAAQRHDADTFEMTREEKQRGAKGETLRHEPIAPFILFCLLSGVRRGEAIALDWKQVDLNALDKHRKRSGEITVLAPKTGHERKIYLGVCPSLRQLLAAQKLRTGGKGRVFEPLTEDSVIKSMRRIKGTHGGPEAAGYQACRRTCSTFLINSQAIPMTLFQAAKQLGHSAVIAEKNYAGLFHDIPDDATTLESAMQIKDLCKEIVSEMQTRRAA
jgi:integrase